MTKSLTTIPQLTHTLTFDATEIMALRKTQGKRRIAWP